MDVLVERGLPSDCRRAQPSAPGPWGPGRGPGSEQLGGCRGLGRGTQEPVLRVLRRARDTPSWGGTSHCWARRKAWHPSCRPCGGGTAPAEECSVDGGTRAGVCADGVPSSGPFPSLVEWVLSASLSSLRPDPPSLVSGDLVTYSLLGMALISHWLCAFRGTGQHVF